MVFSTFPDSMATSSFKVFQSHGMMFHCLTEEGKKKIEVILFALPNKNFHTLFDQMHYVSKLHLLNCVFLLFRFNEILSGY